MQKKNNISHPILLKTRLLCDGGYYSLALAELNQIDGDHIFHLNPIKLNIGIDWLVLNQN